MFDALKYLPEKQTIKISVQPNVGENFSRRLKNWIYCINHVNQTVNENK